MRAYLCNILFWIEHFLTSKWIYHPIEKKSSKPSFVIGEQDEFLNRSTEHKQKVEDPETTTCIFHWQKIIRNC